MLLIWPPIGESIMAALAGGLLFSLCVLAVGFLFGMFYEVFFG